MLPFRSTCHRRDSTDTSARIPSPHRSFFRAQGKVESKDVPKRHLHLNRASARYCSPAFALGCFKATSSWACPVEVWRHRQCIMVIMVSELFRERADKRTMMVSHVCRRGRTSKSRVAPTPRLTFAQNLSRSSVMRYVLVVLIVCLWLV